MAHRGTRGLDRIEIRSESGQLIKYVTCHRGPLSHMEAGLENKVHPTSKTRKTYNSYFSSKLRFATISSLLDCLGTVLDPIDM